ncbi:hypothetical protein DH2020_002125 [Rehmannia glutinosa]|uniref:UDP-glycosyltransferase n=1 Tax=Rehmannia glutinosa TaxID=99300 RepID=A0ABR0XTI7_REHGL
MARSDDEMQLVMLPWLAFGHMIPFLELSIALAKLNIHVSFLSTPKNIQRLPKVPPNLSKLIDFVTFSLPKLDSDLLPEYAEATVDIPADKIEYLKIACDLLQKPVKHFIAKKLPNWIIVDFFHHWAVDIAQDLSIPLIRYFVVTAKTAVSFWRPEFAGEGPIQSENMKIPSVWVDFQSDINASGIPDGARVAKLVQASRAIAIRTCLEFEADYLKIYSNITGKPVFPVGFLPPEKPDRKNLSEEPWVTVFNWLDKQNPSSVVFVGFGSEAKLKKEQIHEIAYGLELSGVPFLWAIRKPDGIDNDLDGLPPGFRFRTAAQGAVHVGWAPQREILDHFSIGGSFFHAGWGSIIEAMQYGHVVVFLPFIIDQPLNARMMVEKGLGIQVETRDEDGSFNRYDIATALRKAMFSEEGHQLRARTEEAAHRIFGDHQLHRNYVNNFAEYLKNEARVGR